MTLKPDEKHRLQNIGSISNLKTMTIIAVLLLPVDPIESYHNWWFQKLA